MRVEPDGTEGVTSDLFWLSDEEWAAIEPHLPKNQRGGRRVDDRRVISGIVHMLRTGGRWRDTPAEQGPPTTVHNRWNRWCRRGIRRRLPARLAEEGFLGDLGHLDGSDVKAHRSAHGGKGVRLPAIGPSRGGQTTKVHAVRDLLGRPVALALTPGNTANVRAAAALKETIDRFERPVADRGHHAEAFLEDLRAAATRPVIPGRINRKKPVRRDKRRYRKRIEATVCRLKDFRRIATRYDKLARNVLSAVALAAALAFRI